MSKKIEISRDFVRAAARHEAVTGQLRVIGERVMRRAKNLAASEGVSMEFWLEQGERPAWRPQVVVYGDNVEQEFGSSRTDRRRILGRAAEEG